MAEYRGHLLRYRQQSRPPRPEISQRQERAASGGKPPRPRLQAKRPNRYSVACSPCLAGRRLVFAQFYHWHKGNAMPESARDRPTRCYEYVFLLTKSKKYYYDWQAVAEPIAPTTAVRLKSGVGKGNKYAATVPGQNQPQKINRPRRKGAYTDEMISPVRSRRNVWQINTASYRGGHFAAFPPKLAETCILAGCPVGGIVLDPFLGSGTTAAAAKSLSRRYIGIEINPEYCTLAKQRIGGDEH